MLKETLKNACSVSVPENYQYYDELKLDTISFRLVFSCCQIPNSTVLIEIVVLRNAKRNACYTNVPENE